MFASRKGAIALLAFIFANTDGSRYILDIVEIKSNTTTPDAVEINLRCVQPTRGILGVSGFIYIKMDTNTDKATGELKILYSSNDISYQLTPFRLPPMSLTNMLNNPRTRKVLKAMEECCTGAAIADPFVSPLEKGVVKCENCLYPNELLPSPMRPGYYKLVILVGGPIIDMAITILLRLEHDF